MENMFREKIILAPMVRVNTIAFRLLCLKYRAHYVYTPEIVDFSLLNCKRIKNNKLQSIDFVNDEGNVMFRTCSLETNKLIFQLGTSSPDRALKILKLVENDVIAFDINMGCPKEFSISGGMGASLLTNPSLAFDILKTLVDNSKIPILCKIRLLPGDIQNTINFINFLLPSGVSCITIHGRTRYMRSSEQCNIEYLKNLIKYFSSFPIIVNGGSLNINKYDDIINFKNKCNASSVMIARAARDNPAIFCNDLINKEDIIKEFVYLCARWDVDRGLFNYMFSHLTDGENKENVLNCISYRDICNEMGIDSLPFSEVETVKEEPLLFDNCEFITLDDEKLHSLRKIRGEYVNKLNERVRCILSGGDKSIKPVFEIKTYSKYFQSCVNVEDRRYVARNLFKNKKEARNATSYAYFILNKIND